MHDLSCDCVKCLQLVPVQCFDLVHLPTPQSLEHWLHASHCPQLLGLAVVDVVVVVVVVVVEVLVMVVVVVTVITVGCSQQSSFSW